MTQPSLTIRMAQEQDLPLILRFIRELAQYEGLLDQVTATQEVLEEWLFRRRKAEVVFPMVEGKEIGFALFFHNFSTFLGRAGLYLEDLYILPEYRGRGYGRALMVRLARIARERGCGRMEWWCLDENETGNRFYRSLGAAPMEEWTVWRLTQEDLARLAPEDD